MAWDKTGSLGKILIGVIIGIFLTCLIIAAAILTIYYFGLNVTTTTHTFSHSILLKPAGNATMSEKQIGSTLEVLHSRFADYGNNVSMAAHRNESGIPYIVISYDDIPPDTIAAVATTPGIFELRIQTSGNESEHVFYGDGIYDVQSPQLVPINRTEQWSVSFSLTYGSREEYKQACIDSGATLDPANHTVMMLLDDQVIYAMPISPYLARDFAQGISAQEIEGMIAVTGTGDIGREKARNVSIYLRSGPLPVKMEVVSPVTNLSYTATVPLS